MIVQAQTALSQSKEGFLPSVGDFAFPSNLRLQAYVLNTRPKSLNVNNRPQHNDAKNVGERRSVERAFHGLPRGRDSQPRIAHWYFTLFAVSGRDALIRHAQTRPFGAHRSRPLPLRRRPNPNL